MPFFFFFSRRERERERRIVSSHPSCAFCLEHTEKGRVVLRFNSLVLHSVFIFLLFPLPSILPLMPVHLPLHILILLASSRLSPAQNLTMFIRHLQLRRPGFKAIAVPARLGCHCSEMSHRAFNSVGSSLLGCVLQGHSIASMIRGFEAFLENASCFVFCLG